MKVNQVEGSIFSQKADAVLFFVDESGNSPTAALKTFPDICQVAQMMTMTKSFSNGMIVFTTIDKKKIIVAQEGDLINVVSQLAEVSNEHEISSVNVASTHFFSSETLDKESPLPIEATSEIIINFCDPLE